MVLVSNPDPPSNPLKRKGGSGEYATTLYTTEFLVAQSDWLMWPMWSLTGFLTTNHLALLITLIQTYSALFQFTEAQQATSKAYVALQQRVHSVRISPGSPLWGRVMFETTCSTQHLIKVWKAEWVELVWKGSKSWQYATLWMAQSVMYKWIPYFFDETPYQNKQ